jgi:hypothetical protein
MPIHRSADYFLADRPYMLWRDGPFKGRSWRRSGEVSVPGFATTRTEQGVENFPEQIQFSEVWDDWSGGFGYPYRTQENPDTYHWGENIDARWPGQIVHAQEFQKLPFGSSPPSGNIDHINAEQIATIPPSWQSSPPKRGMASVVISGFKYYRILTPVGATLFNTESPEIITAPNRHFGGRVAVWGSYSYIPSLDGSNAVGFPFDNGIIISGGSPTNGLAVAGDRLWRYHGNGRLYTSLQSIASRESAMVASNGAWSATLSIGNGRAGIQDMIALNDQLCVGTPEGVFVGDTTGTFYNILNDLSSQSHQDNCRDLAVHNGNLVVQHVAGIWAWNPNEFATQARVREIGPSLLSNRSPLQGMTRALRGYGQWLYAGLWTGSQSYILSGRQVQAEGRYAWHTMQRLPNITRVHRLHFDGVTTNSAGEAFPARMWVATDASIPTNGTAPVYFQPIPALNGNPLAPDVTFSPNYVGSARIDLGAIDRGAPGATKLARRVEVWAESFLSGAQYADVYYTLDRGTRTLLGRAQTSPVSYLYFPSTDGSFALWRQLELSLESFTASVNTTPVYRSVVLSGAILADVVDVISAHTRISDSVVDRNGAPMRPAAQMIRELRELATPSFGPVRMQDLLGNTQIVKVLPPVEEAEVWQDGQLVPEIDATVRMAVLSYSGGI